MTVHEPTDTGGLGARGTPADGFDHGGRKGSLNGRKAPSETAPKPGLPPPLVDSGYGPSNVNGAAVAPPLKKADGQHLPQVPAGNGKPVKPGVPILTVVASKVKSCLQHIHFESYRNVIDAAGLVGGGVAALAGAPGYVATGIMAAAIVGGRVASYVGGPIPPGILWIRERLSIHLPMSISQRDEALSFAESYFNGSLLARMAPREGNPFWTVLLPGCAMRQILEHSNPYAGFAITDEKKTVHGFVLVLPMRSKKLKALMRGDAAFGGLQRDDVLSKPDQDGAVYVDFHLRRTSPPWQRGTSEKDLRAILAALHGTGHILERNYLDGDSKSRELVLYALEKHRPGCKLLLQLGFSKDEAFTAARRDGRTVFRKIINRCEISRLRAEWDISEHDVDIIHNRALVRKSRPNTL